ncbi:MAG TPA: RluA family pseudouridine synthase [Candidatus Kaiserbacteria bacterium]|nr:RluA family pseudouridine synthase [Candidatus Kaiserbacteria bacterium]
MDLEILYEDEDIVVINKPSGIMTHPDGHNESETVSDWFAKKYPQAVDVGESMTLRTGKTIMRPGIVHRLDVGTSGALVLAKSKHAYDFLKNAFKNHNVKKTYLAFVYGVPKPAVGKISFPIGRSRKDFRLRSAQPKAKGRLREALTRYEVVSEIGSHALVKAMPETGRTHQIRTHFKAIHHPVVCDSLYAPNHACDMGFNRLGLHAWMLDVPFISGDRKVFIASIPDEFKIAIARFKNTDFLQKEIHIK